LKLDYRILIKHIDFHSVLLNNIVDKKEDKILETYVKTIENWDCLLTTTNLELLMHKKRSISVDQIMKIYI